MKIYMVSLFHRATINKQPEVAEPAQSEANTPPSCLMHQQACAPCCWRGTKKNVYDGRSKCSETVNHKICTSNFVTFQHSFLQLKCTWSSVSPKFGFHCRRILFSQPYAVQITISPQNNAPSVGIWAHLIYGSFGKPDSTSQTAYRSVPPFLQDSKSQTDRLTDTYSVCNNRPHLHISEMRPDNKLRNIVATDGTN